MSRSGDATKAKHVVEALSTEPHSTNSLDKPIFPILCLKLIDECQDVLNAYNQEATQHYWTPPLLSANKRLKLSMPSETTIISM